MKLYLVTGIVTDPDAAQIFTEHEGREVKMGDTEWRLIDDLEQPGSSADFASKESALAFARERNIEVIEA